MRRYEVLISEWAYDVLRKKYSSLDDEELNNKIALFLRNSIINMAYRTREISAKDICIMTQESSSISTEKASKKHQ